MRRGTSSKVAVALCLFLLVLAAVAALAQAPSPSSSTAATASTAAAGSPPAPAIPAAAVGGPGFDPQAATQAYLDSLGAEKKAKSDAYFEGGYWLTLWELLYGLGVAWILLGTRLSAGMRDLAERIMPFRWLQTWLYAIQYFLVSFVLSFPLAVYTDYFREHQYGLSTQTFGGWLWEGLKGLALGLVLGGLALTALYAVVRKAPRTWWIWGAIVSLLFAVAGIALAPVFIEPLFNKYTELQDPTLRGPILALARANGIPAQHVYVVDASKQSNRVSANVAGLFGTTRIALNDNLLHRGSVAEVKAVMGHEMGHYVLHHVSKSILFIGVVLVIGFVFLRWGFAFATARWGDRWGLRGIADPAGLPLLAALFSIYGFVLTPVFNTQTRTMEAEADIFGLNAAREPDGMAQATLQLSEYRKLSPGPIEEYVFFDHPSGRNRILMAMRWKAEHLGDGPLGK
ncbi:MAG TPA: M48 family metallopeptidase [Thermoanaerobaculia bacterium]|nr:M48 family metallopeptidase [Thermoanaerobaculia bacterium]